MPFRRRPPEVSSRAWEQLAGGRRAQAPPNQGVGTGPGLAEEELRPVERRAPDDEGRGGRHRSANATPPLMAVPQVLRQARWTPSRTAVVGVALLVLVVVAILALRVAWSSARSDAAGATPTPSTSLVLSRGDSTLSAPGDSAAGSSATPRSSSSSFPGGSSSSGAVPAGPSPPGTALVVDVVGQVHTPGIVRLAAGARVVDALTAAGGALPGADVAALNLARVLTDGEQIRVPRPGEVVTPPAGPLPAPSNGGATSGQSGSGAMVSLNSASVTDLDSLPGVGPVLAQRILDWRTQHGRFSSIDELGEVSGIGEKLLEQLRPKVTL